MTPLKLPRPYKPKLAFREAAVLDCLKTLDREQNGIVATDAEQLAAILSIPLNSSEESIMLLNRCNCIALGSKHVAILLQLSRALRLERERNRIRCKRGRSGDWHLHRRAAQLFPALRGPVSRPETYNRPAAFEPLLKQHPHYHKRACPADVEILTEACYPGELSTVLTFIEEQASANRTPVLLYTRKAIYVGVRRAPKR